MKSPPKARGRKSLLDAKLQREICSLLAAGNTIKTCCDAVGIGERTFFDWCEQFPHFAQATTRARAQSKIKLVKIITDAAMVDARHAEWLLERCHPSEFGRAAQPQPPKPVEVEFSSEEFARLMDKINAGEKQRPALNSK
jgi:hypothetical protein